MLNSPRKNIIVALLFSLSLCVLLFILFPLNFHRKVVESSAGMIGECEDIGRKLFRQEQRDIALRETAAWTNLIREIAEDPMFAALPEEERRSWLLSYAEEEGTSFFIIDGEGRFWGPGGKGEALSYDRSVPPPEGIVFEILGSGEACIGYFEPWDWLTGVYVGQSAFDSVSGEFKRHWESFTGKILTFHESSAFLLFFLLVCIIFSYSLLVNYFIYREKGNFNELSHYYRALNDSLCLMVTDRDGIITKVNENYEKISGYSEEELLGKNHFTGHHPDSVQEQREAMRKALYSSHRWRGLLKGLTPSGESYWLQTLISEMWDRSGEVNGFLAVAQDVTELYSQKKKLERAVSADPLTGFGNRLKLIKDLDGEPGSTVACYNIDGFSNINKLFGFSLGDSLLLEVGKHLNGQLLPDREELYRLNGDTFVVRGYGEDEEDFIARNIERQELLSPLSFEKGTLPYSVSLRMGIASCSQNTLLLADSALKGAKSDTRGYMIIREADDEQNSTGLKQIEQLNLIKSALENDRLSIVFQPIATTSTGDIVKYECLLRVQDEQGMVVSPSELIEVAKKGRLYKQITRFVINEVMKACEKSDKDFSINFTLEDFLDAETVDYLIEQAAVRDVSRRIILEIVETEELVDYESLEVIFRRIKEKGFRIAIDDFGSGFSNFNYLLRLNVDYIKIDGSLIRNILTDEKSQSLVISIILFAVESGFQTIAEYIENPDILERIRSLGVDFAQGYHIGKPGELP